MNLPKFLSSVETFLGSGGAAGAQQAPLSIVNPTSPGSSEPTPDSIAPYMEHVFDVAASTEAARDLNNLPFGAFELDKGGAILRYNDSEAEITGRAPYECLGLNFFTEVAPCTRKPEFLGRFMEGVKSGSLDALFQFQFTFKDTGTRVWVCMKKAPRTQTFWIFLKRII